MGDYCGLQEASFKYLGRAALSGLLRAIFCIRRSSGTSAAILDDTKHCFKSEFDLCEGFPDSAHAGRVATEHVITPRKRFSAGISAQQLRSFRQQKARHT